VQSAGVDLLRNLGDSIQHGEPLYRVHAAYPSDLEFAAQLCRKASGYTLGQAHEVPHVFVEF
jgi:thymidine phosphorylase